LFHGKNRSRLCCRMPAQYFSQIMLRASSIAGMDDAVILRSLPVWRYLIGIQAHPGINLESWKSNMASSAMSYDSFSDSYIAPSDSVMHAFISRDSSKCLSHGQNFLNCHVYVPPFLFLVPAEHA